MFEQRDRALSVGARACAAQQFPRLAARVCKISVHIALCFLVQGSVVSWRVVRVLPSVTLRGVVVEELDERSPTPGAASTIITIMNNE